MSSAEMEAISCFVPSVPFSLDLQAAASAFFVLRSVHDKDEENYELVPRTWPTVKRPGVLF